MDTEKSLAAAPLRLEQFDKSTYFGRICDFVVRLNMKYLFISHEKIESAKRIVQLAQKGDWHTLKEEKVSQSDYFKAKTTVEACVHPQTLDIIPIVGRVCMFCPINVPISAGMLLTPPTVVNLIGWQWFNQTYNAYFNTCNANKSAEGNAMQSFWEANKETLKGYISATVVSVGLAVGLTQWLKRGRFSPNMRRKLQAVVPYFAVASAGASNVVLMRLNELKTGIDVFAPDGEHIGKSVEAAKKALLLTGISRLVLPLPILGLPPPILAFLYRYPFITSNQLIKVPTELSVLLLGLLVGFPCAIALFPQQQSMKVEELEPSVQNMLTTEQKNKYSYVTFNKGI